MKAAHQMNVLAPISHLYIHLERAFCGIFLLACKKNLKFYCETWQAILVFTDEVSISITRFLLLVLSSTSGVISSLLCDNGDDERRGEKTRTGVVKREKSNNVKGAVAKTNQLPFYIFTLFT